MFLPIDQFLKSGKLEHKPSVFLKHTLDKWIPVNVQKRLENVDPKQAFLMIRKLMAPDAIPPEWRCDIKHINEDYVYVDAECQNYISISRDEKQIYWEINFSRTLEFQVNFPQGLSAIMLVGWKISMDQQAKSATFTTSQWVHFSKTGALQHLETKNQEREHQMREIIRKYCATFYGRHNLSRDDVLRGIEKACPGTLASNSKLIVASSLTECAWEKQDLEDFTVFLFITSLLVNKHDAKKWCPKFAKSYAATILSPHRKKELKLSEKRIQQLEKECASKEMTIHSFSEKVRLLESKIVELQGELLQGNKSLRSIPNDSSEVKLKEEQIERLNAEFESAKRNEAILSRKICTQEQIIQHLRNKLSRPTKIDKVAEWAAEQFSDRLLITDNAAKLLVKARGRAINLDLLCDAIEYLAEEYLGCMRGEMDWNELNEVCSYKYNRSFRVAPSSDFCATLPEYNIKYNGKTVFLNLHLVWGNDPETLIRIYFYYDKEHKLIIVGSLPDHLPVMYTQ